MSESVELIEFLLFDCLQPSAYTSFSFEVIFLAPGLKYRGSFKLLN